MLPKRLYRKDMILLNYYSSAVMVIIDPLCDNVKAVPNADFTATTILSVNYLIISASFSVLFSSWLVTLFLLIGML